MKERIGRRGVLYVNKHVSPMAGFTCLSLIITVSITVICLLVTERELQNM